MGSTVNSEAIRAVEELRRKGWLTDGSLQKAYLPKANLEGVDLSDADLRESNLENAILKDAILNNANLSHTRLGGANFASAIMEKVDMRKSYLVRIRHSPMKQINTGWYMAGSTGYDIASFRGAYMRFADLRETIMIYTDFEKATLDFANLDGAEVQGVNWKGADLINSELRNLKLRTSHEFEFDEETRFPDGQQNVSNPIEYFARFVFPDHSQFWRSSNSSSPAYSQKR